LALSYLTSTKLLSELDEAGEHEDRDSPRKTRKFRKTSGFLKSRDRSEAPERNKAWDDELCD